MRIVIIGGGASGASCATRLRRLSEENEIIILEKTDAVSIASCGLPYYTSDVISERKNLLVQTPKKFKEVFNIDVRLGSEVTGINPAKKTVTVNNEYELTYDKLVLAQGASPIVPKGMDKQRVFTLKNIPDAENIKAMVQSGKIKDAVVIGGGFVGIEMAENFAVAGINTTLVEAADQILAPLDKDMVSLAQNKMRDNGINLCLSDGVREILDDEIILNSGKRLPYDTAVLSIGVKPETLLAETAGLKLGTSGGIAVSESMQTSNPDIYAAGDSIEVQNFVTDTPALIPLAGPANRQGRIAADAIMGIKSTYKKSLGTAVIKIFDYTAASVGANEKLLKQLNIPYKKVHVWGFSNASYYPGYGLFLLKLIFGEDGRIFGAQGVGSGAVEKRIDVISTVIRLGGKVQDLIDSELCYAPPYSSAKDPVNVIGMAAENILKGYVKPAYFEDLHNAHVIDVREEEIFEKSTIEGAVNQYIVTLRNNLEKIPKNKKVILVCNKGFTSYLASKILVNNDFDNIYNFSGGNLLYQEIIKNRKDNLIFSNI